MDIQRQNASKIADQKIKFNTAGTKSNDPINNLNNTSLFNIPSNLFMYRL
jgi:hypothetical protein